MKEDRVKIMKPFEVKYSLAFRETDGWIELLKQHIDSWILNSDYEIRFNDKTQRVMVNNHCYNAYDYDYFMRDLKHLYYNVWGNHCVDFVELLTSRDLRSAMYEMIMEVENDSKEEE